MLELCSPLSGFGFKREGATMLRAATHGVFGHRRSSNTAALKAGTRSGEVTLSPSVR